MKLYDLITNIPIYKMLINEKTSRKARDLQKHIPHNSNVLDIGCGNFYVGRELVSIDPTVHITGIDQTIFPELSHICNDRLSFVQSDAQNMPFRSESFDITYLLVTLHHMKNHYDVLNEAKRVTKKDGKIIVREECPITKAGKLALSINDLAHNFFKPDPSLYFSFRYYDGWLELFKKCRLDLDFSEEFKEQFNRVTHYQFHLNPRK